jgi:hypothetical protein
MSRQSRSEDGILRTFCRRNIDINRTVVNRSPYEIMVTASRSESEHVDIRPINTGTDATADSAGAAGVVTRSYP